MPRAKNGAATAEKKISTRSKKSAFPTNGNSDLSTAQVLSLTEEQIRQRAYEIYESRGRQDGAHESDWFAAEAELRSRTA